MRQTKRQQPLNEWLVALVVAVVHICAIAMTSHWLAVVWWDGLILLALARLARSGRLCADLPLCFVMVTIFQSAEPAFGFGWPIWLTLVPIFYVIRREPNRWRLVGLGLWTGLLCATGIYGWLWEAMRTFWEMSLVTTLPVFLIVTLLIGLQMPIFFVLTRLAIERIPLSIAIVGPVVYAVVEYWMPLPFPMAMALAFSRHPILLQWADVAGMGGITLLIVIVNGACFAMIEAWRGKRQWQFSTAGLMLACVLGFHFGYGLYGLRHYQPLSSDDVIDVAMVQPVAPLKVLNKDHSTKQKIANRLRDLSLEAVGEEPPDFLIWPEGAAPFASRFPEYNSEYMLAVKSIQRETSTTIVVQDIDFTRLGDASRVRYYSTVSVIGPDGEPLGQYRKNILMPFAEYMPGESWFPFLKRLFPQTRSALAGKEMTLLNTPGGPAIPLVCYEIMFPKYVRQFAAVGGRYMINQTNDRWYGARQQPIQHLTFAVFRAIENRKPLIRSTNSGISALIDARGVINSGGQTGIMKQATLRGRIYPRSGQTFYGRHGDVVHRFGLTPLLVIAFMGRIVFRRRGKEIIKTKRKSN